MRKSKIIKSRCFLTASKSYYEQLGNKKQFCMPTNENYLFENLSQECIIYIRIAKYLILRLIRFIRLYKIL